VRQTEAVTAELDEARNELRARLGRYGIWRGRPGVPVDFAVEAERLGFGSLWTGGSPQASLVAQEELLNATERIIIATGIVNIWTADAAEVAESFHRLEAAHPGRFLLGVGVGHPERVDAARHPLGPVIEYLDVLESRGVPRTRLVLASLGPRMLELAGERTLGTHPYFVTPEHARYAREILGASPLIIPEQLVAMESDPATARALLRPGMAFYFPLTTYRSNLLRIGVPEAVLDPDNDEGIDRLAVWGTPERIRAGLDAHLDAGADHVIAQLIVPDDRDQISDLRALAAALGLNG